MSSSSNNEKVNIRFETLDGRFFDCQLGSSREMAVKTKAIKPLLEDQFGIPASDQELIFHDTTSQLLLHDDAALYPSQNQRVVVRPKACEITIRIVQQPTETEICRLTVNSKDSIGHVKRQMREQLGVPEDKQELYFGVGGECHDHHALRYYQIADNSVLYLIREVGRMQLFVDMRGCRGVEQKIFTVNVGPNTTIDTLMVKIQYLSGIPPHDQRILSHGAGLFGPQTLSQLHIEHESTVQVMRGQSGMISSFSFNDMNDPLVRYLMLPEEERQVTPFPLEAIHQRHPQAAHKFTTSSFTFQKNCNVLSACHRAVLAQFLDFMWSTQMAKNDTAVDMKVVLPDDLLVDLLRPFADRCQDQHEEQWSPKQVFDKLDNMRSWRTPKIALRMTKGPTKACINFHQDGDYATYTMQLALNGPEQYQGGKLCCFSNNRLEVLTRPAGSLVGHPRELLHAVTALTGGVRKSLFLVDESNGLGDKDVITASQEDVSAFWDSDLASLCSFCFLQFPSQNCNGCWNKSLCTKCAQLFGECPVCCMV